MSLPRVLTELQGGRSGWRSTLIDLQTASTISGARLQLDALRIARSLSDGGLLPRGSAQGTVLVHLPNCLPFVAVAIGALEAGATLVLANPELPHEELETILRTSQPDVIVTSTGTVGEGTIEAAVSRILDSSDRSDATNWARQLSHSLTLASTTRLHPSEPAPFRHRRIWTVNPDADYYGTSFLLRAPTMPAPASRTDAQDWSVLLLPPPGHKHAGNQDVDQVESMALSGKARLPFQRQEGPGASKSTALLAFSAGEWKSWSHTAAVDAVRAIIDHSAFTSSNRDATGPWLSTLPWTSPEGFFGQVLSSLASDACLLALRRQTPDESDSAQISRLLASQGTALAHVRSVAAAEALASRASELPRLRAIAVAEDTARTDANGIPLISLTRQVDAATPPARSRL